LRASVPISSSAVTGQGGLVVLIMFMDRFVSNVVTADPIGALPAPGQAVACLENDRCGSSAELTQ
jgi:hypothetical protein